MFNRRRFLAYSFLSGAVLLTAKGELFSITTPLSTIEQMHKDLFPQSPNTPDHKDINAIAYLKIILNHDRVSQSDKEFITNSIKWLNEECKEKFNKSYVSLDASQRQEILKSISKTKWGRSFIKDVMGYFFEAMLCDPIYGSNKNETGWRWLNYTPGYPRPKKALL